MNLYSKIMIYVFLIFCTVSLSFANGTVENLMHQANNLYQQNEYGEAVKLYQQILEEGYESEAVHFNLGNSYFRMNKLGYAILNYEKALRLAPDDEDIKYNILIANARTVDKIKELPKLFIIEWWELLVTSLSPNNWLILILIFYYLFLLTIAGYFLIGKFNFQKYLAYWGIINFVILICITILLFARLNREASTDFGVLIESAITVKQSPSEKGNDVFVIHEGIKFEIEDRLDNWAKIKLADGKVGWLPEKSFEKI